MHVFFSSENAIYLKCILNKVLLQILQCFTNVRMQIKTISQKNMLTKIIINSNQTENLYFVKRNTLIFDLIYSIFREGIQFKIIYSFKI